MPTDEEIVELWEQTYDEGYACGDCRYMKLIDEPHGAITRLCSVEHDILECPVVEFNLTGEPPAYEEYKERRAGLL